MRLILFHTNVLFQTKGNEFILHKSKFAFVYAENINKLDWHAFDTNTKFYHFKRIFNIFHIDNHDRKLRRSYIIIEYFSII